MAEGDLLFRMDASIAALERQLARAEARVSKTANEIERKFKASNKGVTEGLARAGQEIANVTRISGANKAALTNVGFQFQDMAVQIAGGTSASRAMAQQLPQLLGSLGLVGVFAGTAAAVLIPLFATMFRGQSDVQVLTEQLGLLKNAMADLRAADSGARSSLVDLTEKYGSQAEKARELLQIEREIAAARAQEAFSKASGSWFGAVADSAGGSASLLTESSSAELQRQADMVEQARAEYAKLSAEIEAFGDIQTAADQAAWDGLQNRRRATEMVLRDTNQYRDGIAALGAEFGVTEAAAAQLAVAAARVREADNTEDRVEAARQLALLIKDSAEQTDLASDTARVLYDNLLDAVKSGLELEALDIATAIGAGADEALRLAQNLAAAKQWSAVGSTAGAGWRPAEQGVISTGPASGSGVVKFAAPKKGGGGGGKGKSDDEREAARIIAQTRTEAEKLVIEMEKLQNLRDLGLIDEETFSRAKSEMEGLNATAKDAASAIKNAFMGLFDDPARALKDLAAQLAQMLFFAQLAKSFPSVFGAGGIIPLGSGYAAGGYTGAGGTTDPAGVVHRGEIVWSQRDIARAGGVSVVEAMRLGQQGYAGGGYVSPVVPAISAGGAGGGGVQIFDQRGANAPAIETRTRRGPNGRETVMMIVREEMTKGGLDKPMRGRFGTPPQTVIR